LNVVNSFERVDLKLIYLRPCKSGAKMNFPSQTSIGNAGRVPRRYRGKDIYLSNTGRFLREA